MAVFLTYDSDWHDHFIYHANPFRTSLGSDTEENRQAVPTGINPNNRAPDWSFTGVGLRPRRFNQVQLNTDWNGNQPFDTMEELNAWNSGWWSGVLLTPRHIGICRHFWKTVRVGPRSFDGPWPEEANLTSNKSIVFMNEQGEYLVRNFELATPFLEDSSGTPTQAFMNGRDALLLVLDEEIPESSGIKIYNKCYVLDNDQVHAVTATLDSQNKIYHRDFNGFIETEMDNTTSSGMRYVVGDRVTSLPKLPTIIQEGSDDTQINIMGTGNAGDNVLVFGGDSGSPTFVYSESRGVVYIGQPGGTVSVDNVGPMTDADMELFQGYLETFNTENGTDYTYDWEVIKDARKEFLIPPTQTPLSCVTQEAMRSRKLICEVTATSSTGEVVTVRSEPLLAQSITIAPIINDTAFRYNATSELDGITRAVGEDNEVRFEWTIGDQTVNPSYDPMTPFTSGFIRLVDEDGNSTSANIPPDSFTPWRPNGQVESLVIPANFRTGTLTATLSISNTVGTTEMVRSVELIDADEFSIEPIGIGYFAEPTTEFETGHIEISLQGVDGGIVQAFIRNEDQTDGGVPVTFIPDGAIPPGGSDTLNIPITYTGIPPSAPINCSNHSNGDQFIFLDASVTLSTGEIVAIGPTFAGQTEFEPSILISLDNNGNPEPICQ